VKNMLARLLLPTALLVAMPGLAVAEVGPEDIRAAGADFMQRFAAELKEKHYEVSYEIGAVGSRITLADCSDAINVEFTTDPWQSTRPTLAVSCEGPQPWRLYVPSEIEIRGSGFLTSRPIGRGERLTPADFRETETLLNISGQQVIRDPQLLVGMETRRPLNAGTRLTPSLLTAPAAVERGDHVVITARSGAFSVATRGKALAKGSVGDQIPVQNLSSLRTVQAEIIATGKVAIPM